ncbi:MAG: hypothetical protein ACFN25_05145 [Leptotrichia wadei]|nr:MAG TPA: hypothetical protein [Caudoviricetes sp.]
MEKKLIEKCYEEMLVFLKDNFVEKSGIESLEDENNITDIIHIFTAMRKSKYRDSEKEKEIKQEIYKNLYKCTELKDFRNRNRRCVLLLDALNRKDTY